MNEEHGTDDPDSVDLAEVAEVAEVAEGADFDKSEFNPSDPDRKIWTGIRKLISFFKK